MKVIALEEHFVSPEVVDAWLAVPGAVRDYAVGQSLSTDARHRLLDLADARIADMDASGVDVQVLSMTTSGVQNLNPGVAVPLARAANDVVAHTMAACPQRFQGFATLPVSAPFEAAREFRRAVCDLGLDGAMVFGRCGDRNVDHPEFFPILEVAAELRAPLYLHPQSPAPSVQHAYYSGFEHELASIFGAAGIGWHYEAGIQALRLVLAGVFDRLPELQLILGHWGEVILFYLDRIDLMTEPAGLPRKVSEYFATNVSVTPSGVLSQRYLRWAIEVLGADRVLFATDYPFGPRGGDIARRFLEEADLCAADRDGIASDNWERLRAGVHRC